ncbi:MAG: hypothetical protein IPJ30_21730 [Acidobacteria bacterium]|nr:hypothetical protein [Acidobacteriota bacterium]
MFGSPKPENAQSPRNTESPTTSARNSPAIKDDETGLDFAEARMYENRHGRFTAVDPLLASGKSANPQIFNRYTYVMNSPLVNTDPTGLQNNQIPYEGGTIDGNLSGLRVLWFCLQWFEMGSNDGVLERSDCDNGIYGTNGKRRSLSSVCC